MLQKIIWIFLLGIILESILNFDFYFLILIFLVTVFSTIFFANKNNFESKSNIKNLITEIFKNIFLFIIFLFAILYTKYESKPVTQNLLNSNNLEIIGKVALIEEKINQKNLIIKISSIKNLDGENSDFENVTYVSVPVSSFLDVEPADKIKVTGENNSASYIKKVTQGQSLIKSYEYEKLFFDADFSVSPFSKVQIMENAENIGYTDFLETSLYKILNFGNILQKKLSNHMSEPYSSIASGISLGKTNFLSEEIKNKFIDSGLIHLLVLSGTNVTFIILTFYFLIRKLFKNVSNARKVFLTIFISWIFIFSTGLYPPSIRAGIMASLALLSELSGRGYSLILAMMVALFLESLLDPLSLLYNPSLHLSFLACFALFVVTPVVEFYLNILITRFEKYKTKKSPEREKVNLKEDHPQSYIIIAVALLVSMTISMPVYISGLTGSSSVAGSLLTIFAEPVIFLSMLVSFLIIIFDSVFYFGADVLGIFNSYLTSYILYLADFGQENFSKVNLNLSKSFVVVFYIIFISGFSFVYKKILKNNNLEK